ncbi:short-chain dehydrogenase, putative [Talaromyces marneffei ATCC 18224]|uniref:Short-chain dehydrogenase, putative n=1 Tax=Talaromyces marneffei (strain ATCC 18224 / CBS 334.59 / QM 7333) TaxID=441960 RepID=B6QNA4_TALMQ|nr:short-chain dehydrogenase, putative [Talaromyces marneffei ATCC 18224]
MVSTLSAMFPPSPSFTEKDLPSLVGEVFIITGAASGVGFELAKILYVAGGTIYVAARSATRCEGAIEKIKDQTRGKKAEGVLKPMILDLADLRTIKRAVEDFQRQETRLDVLVNNAGVMNTPVGSKGTQGHDLEMATNCVGPYLLTRLLEPILIQTAASSPRFSVRVVFVVALMQLFSPATAMEFYSNGTPKVLPGDGYMKSQPGDNYMQTKIGGTWLAAEFANRLGSKEILSVSVHPGLMRTELQRNMTVTARVSMKLLFRGPVYGAYSELFAAFSPKLTAENNGGYVLAWGRIAELPKYITDGLKSKSEGGTGGAKMFMNYCERETRRYQ